jgi:hypothetical protein
MVKQGDKLPDMDQVLDGSPFEDSRECIKGVFSSMDVTTVYDLENTPRSLTCSFCGISTHKLIEHILAWMANPPVLESPAPEPEPEPELVAVVLEEVVEEVPEEDENPKPAPKKTTSKRKGRTSSSRNKE